MRHIIRNGEYVVFVSDAPLQPGDIEVEPRPTQGHAWIDGAWALAPASDPETGRYSKLLLIRALTSEEAETFEAGLAAAPATLRLAWSAAQILVDTTDDGDPDPQFGQLAYLLGEAFGAERAAAIIEAART
ncbi:MAG: hypothetical protein ACK4WC_00075 [Rubrimonas sp.]